MIRPQPAKPYANGTWTRARYFAFIRSALRRAYTRWPPVYATRTDARRAHKGKNKRQKWEYKCASIGSGF
jgi:hypothetical protein